MDVVLLGLPHKVSAGAVPRMLGSGRDPIIDLSGDFRLKDAGRLREVLRRRPPGARTCSTEAVYGLPEVNRDADPQGAKLIASPGCFATAIKLGLLPLARTGLLEGGVETVGITGSSGSGVAPSAGTHHPVRAMNLKTYKPLDPPAPPRDPPDAHASRARGALAPLRAGERAALARHLRDELRPRRRAHDQGAARGGLPQDLRGRALRPRAREAPARGRRRERVELRRGGLRARPGRGQRARRSRASRRPTT